MPLIWLMKEFPYTMLFLFMQGVIGFFLMYTIQNEAGEFIHRYSRGHRTQWTHTVNAYAPLAYTPPFRVYKGPSGAGPVSSIHTFAFDCFLICYA